MKHVDKRGRGRPKKDNIKQYRYMIRFNDRDNERFLLMYKQSNARSVSQFIAEKVLNHQLKVVEINKSVIEFVILLSQFFVQMRGIKNNYNQVFSTLSEYLGEEKARGMLRIIEHPTLDFIHSWRKLESITLHFREKWLPK